jgi:hypothetical protein
MSRALTPVALILSTLLAAAPALGQAGGGGSGGASGGGGSAGGGSSVGGGAPAAGSAPAATGPAPGSVVPSGSVSPTTGDVSSGSAIPRARGGQELGAGQPGEGTARNTGTSVTGGISGRAQGTASAERVREQNERDRAIDRDLISGGGICEGCEKPVGR